MISPVNLTLSETCKFFESVQAHTDRLIGRQVPFVCHLDRLNWFPTDHTVVVEIAPSQQEPKDVFIEQASVKAAELISSKLRSLREPTVELGSVIETRVASTNPQNLELIMSYSIGTDMSAERVDQ
jgi:hypothetical protein